ncbi:MAG: putative manganese transporter [Candidatus Gracilibacteria bacterium]
MWDVLLDALIDTAKTIPFLLVIYVLIEVVEYRYGKKIREKVQQAGRAGPVIGAVAGSFPQCGFSVLTTALYTQRLVTIGTLLAVYLSTSDEAIPVILSQPGAAKLILPLILTKILIAVVAGVAIDFIFRKHNQKILAHIEAYAHGEDEADHNHACVVEESACCGHCLDASARKFKLKELFFHPLIHTMKIFVFILGMTVLLNGAIFWMGEEAFARLFSGHVLFQPILAALIGLIPNCAASVAITQLYLTGAITYGAMISGLCAGGGLGLLVLFREEKNKKDVFKILALLLGVSVVAGWGIQYFPLS